MHVANLGSLCKLGISALAEDDAERAGAGNERSLGLLLAEQFDFGTARKISALYQALLQITPFSRDAAHRHSNMLADRNLIVHHGGTYTSQYLEQRGVPDVPEQYRVYMDSLEISPARFLSDAEYPRNIARDTVRASHDALVRFLEAEDMRLQKIRSQPYS